MGKGATIFCEGIAMHEHCLTNCIDVKGDYIKIKALKAWALKELVIDWLTVCFSRRFQHFYYIVASGAPIDAFLIKILWPLLYTFLSQTLTAFQHNYRRKNG